MAADQEISQNSRKAKHHGADARLRDRNRRETGLISYHRAVLRNLSGYFALGGVIVGLRPNAPAVRDSEPSAVSDLKQGHDADACGGLIEIDQGLVRGTQFGRHEGYPFLGQVRRRRVD
jgi:hypothetical protein